jgi:hypothetical protein
MKINRNKGNLQSQLAKMLQAGMENVETESTANNQGVNIEGLHANEQTSNSVSKEDIATEAPQIDENKFNNNESMNAAQNIPQSDSQINGETDDAEAEEATAGTDSGEVAGSTEAPQTIASTPQQPAAPAASVATRPAASTAPAATRPAARPSARVNHRQTVKAPARSRHQRQQEPAPQRLNAAQRHEVPDHNAKYAGEPIKSVGCRMPQSLYARMLQYKAMNDSQLNRITLNDIIIEAVEKFMDENG